MNWQFSIIDRSGNTHRIKEPVGWDAFVLKIQRDLDKHGLIIDFQENNFDTYDGYMLVKAEYEQYGIEADLTLVIEWGCDGSFEELHRGKLLFAQQETNCGDKCYASISIETTSDIMEVINRLDQTVDLLSTTAFDGITALAPYNKLGFPLLLPSKAIVLQNVAEWTQEKPTTPNLSEVGPGQTDTSTDPLNYAWFNIVPQFDKVNLSEFGKFSPDDSPNNQWVCGAVFNSLTTCPDLERVETGNNTNTFPARQVLFDWSVNTPMLVNENNNNNFDAVKKFNLTVSFTGEIHLSRPIITFYSIVVIRRSNGTFEYLDKIIHLNSGYNSSGGNTGYWFSGSTHTFSLSGTYTDVVLNDGDYLFVANCGSCFFNHSDIAANADAFTVKYTAGNFKTESLSKTEPTLAKYCMVNEAWSRVVESISNDKVRMYSDYFGRPDSQPYAAATDGCGSLEAISKGIFIRRQENRNGGTAAMGASMKSMWDGLNPIHHLGYGFEPDPARPGFNRLRVEPWKFFYDDTVVLQCIGVKSIKTKVIEKDHYSTVVAGFQKWAAEDYNGLDEFLTKRNMRTSLSQVRNELTILSEFIASGYATEITRRKGNDDSKDWRYDNDTFITCLERKAVFEVTFSTTPGNGSFSFAFSGDVNNTFGILLPGSTLDILVAGTLHNDGIQTVSGYYYDGITLTFLIASIGTPITTAEVASAVTFLGLTFQPIVELGNIDTPTNIIDPDSIYNFRISPMRNLMRWIDKIFSGYRIASANNQLIFMDGEGNYFASGKMKSANCRWENTVIAENITLTPALFSDLLKATPILRPERVVYDFPISVADFKTVRANPRGLIYYESANCSGNGWIESISYQPKQGMASFNLIPKYE